MDPSLVQTAGGIDDEICPGALLAIGDLPGENLVEFGRGHTGSGEHALALLLICGRHHDHLVERHVAARFEQQRDVEQEGGRIAVPDVLVPYMGGVTHLDPAG